MTKDAVLAAEGAVQDQSQFQDRQDQSQDLVGHGKKYAYEIIN